MEVLAGRSISSKVLLLFEQPASCEIGQELANVLGDVNTSYAIRTGYVLLDLPDGRLPVKERPDRGGYCV
jgi:hypothetical protein